MKLIPLFLLLLAVNAFADNGAVAFAFPMEHISIDGDLSDWPSGLTKYPIQTISKRGIKPNSNLDFSANFRVGFNLENNSIYIAVEVQDESFVIDRSINPSWSQQDKHLLYIDPKHSKRGSCPISYSATQIKREIGGSAFGWDPQTKHANWDNIELQIVRKDNKTIYEYRIQLEAISTNSVIGLDHVIYDKDITDNEDDYSYIMWGDIPGKSGAPKRTGDLVLLESETLLRAVNGTVSFIDQSKLNGKQIRISQSTNSNFWITAKIDSLGRYSSQLPEGDYFIDFPDAYIDFDKDEKRIDSDAKMEFSVLNTKNIIPAFEVRYMAKPKLNKSKGILHDFSKVSQESLDDFMEKMMNYYAIPGASLGIIVDGKLNYHKVYGVKNALTLEPIGENTIFQAASITKPVFAYTVLKLSDQEIIDLDKPLHQYLAFEEIENDVRYKKMTARHVLSHQTGLPNWGRKLNFEPGTDYGYSGEGFEYLMRVVEHITKRSILDILDEHVLVPFEMTENTYFVREQEMYPKVALGHHYNLPANNWIINRVGMARSMYTESKEFANFILAFVEGKGLLEKTYEDLFSSQVSMPIVETNPVADWQRSFGLGVLIKESPFGKAYSHGGSNRYFQSLFEYYKEGKMGFVIFCNNDMGYHLGNDLRDFLIIGNDLLDD